MNGTISEKIRIKGRQLKRNGVWFVLKKFARDHVYSNRQYIFLSRDLALPHKDYARRRNWTIRILDGARDIDLFRVHFDSNIKTVRKLFDGGHIVGAAFIDEVLVGYGSVATESFFDPYSSHLIELKENEVYQFDVLLIPKYRGTLIVLDAMRFLHQYLHEAGYRRTICLVNTERHRNIKLHFKLGFEEMGTILNTRKFLFFRRSKQQAYQGKKLAHFSPGHAKPAGPTGASRTNSQ